MSDSNSVQLNQAISILNQCRNQIRVNKAENALAILDRPDLHKWLFCNKEISAWNYTTKALAYNSLHNWRKMYKNIQLALDLDEWEEENIEIHLSLLELLTFYYINVKQFSKALKSAQILLELLLSENVDKTTLFNVYGLLSQIFLKLNNSKASELAFKKQIEVAGNQEQSLAVAYSNLTNFYKTTKNQQLYLKHLSKELKLLKSHPIEQPIKWQCLKDYADFLKNHGYYVKALVQYENSLMFVQENSLFKEEAYICLQIAEINTQIDDDLEALTYYQHCLSILFNLPYRELTMKCINGYLDMIERQIIDYDLLVEFCNECIKFNLPYIAQSLLNSFIDQNLQLDERFIHLAILLNSNDKGKCVYLLRKMLNYNSDPLILNTILRVLIELGNYEQSCEFYNKWRSMDYSFGYLEMLMMSKVDGNLNVTECLEMSLKLNANSQLYFLDLFCLYEHVETELYLMLELETQLHWLIYKQNLMEIEAKMELIGDVQILDKLFATLLGCNIDFDINLIYTSCKYLASDEFKLLTVLSVLFYYDQPFESLYCLQKLNSLYLQNELSKCGYTNNIIHSKTDFQKAISSTDNFTYCFEFSTFKFAWLKTSNNGLELIYCHENNPLTFNEKMLHQIVQKLQLIEVSKNEFNSETQKFNRHETNLVEKRRLDYEIGVLLIGDLVKFANNDGFIPLNVQNGLKQVSQVKVSSIIFVDSHQISPLFLLKNNFQSEILIVIGNKWSSLNDALFSLTRCVILFDTVEEISYEFIDQINLLLEGRTINVDELKKYAQKVYSNVTEIKIQCSTIQTRLKLKRVLKSNDKLQLSNVFAEIAALYGIESKELMKCQKSSIFKTILFNNNIEAIQQIDMEPERTILNLLFADYFYGTKQFEKLSEKDRVKIEKLALMFEESDQLRRSCRSFKYKNNANMCTTDNLSNHSESSENDEAKVLDVSLPINY